VALDASAASLVPTTAATVSEATSSMVLVPAPPAQLTACNALQPPLASTAAWGISTPRAAARSAVLLASAARSQPRTAPAVW